MIVTNTLTLKRFADEHGIEPLPLDGALFLLLPGLTLMAVAA